ncbi:hypothetical protein A0256_07285 [Mucilaginibacter sp. PAMC 26640]|nr:hypothetical protein A0256_07285 [Mucilaginibacter sp. PAMC 26640]
MNREQKSRRVLQSAFISYLIGCVLWYFISYKNAEIIQIAIVAFILASAVLFISEFKSRNVISKNVNGYKTVFVVIFLIVFITVFGVIDNLAKVRVDNILSNGPIKSTTATVVKVDMRSTRSGKQAWSIINYKTAGTIIEQSFADTSDPQTGKKYLIEYSVQYPDMFRVLKTVK